MLIECWRVKFIFVMKGVYAIELFEFMVFIIIEPAGNQVKVISL